VPLTIVPLNRSQSEPGDSGDLRSAVWLGQETGHNNSNKIHRPATARRSISRLKRVASYENCRSRKRPIVARSTPSSSDTTVTIAGAHPIGTSFKPPIVKIIPICMPRGFGLFGLRIYAGQLEFRL
jgi:hypothetical protein